MSWLLRMFRRQHLYDELGEEIREHLEEKTEQLMRLENLSPVEARQAALRAFGNPALVETRSREVWQWSRLESVLADLAGGLDITGERGAPKGMLQHHHCR